jgi:hypothetical protein
LLVTSVACPRRKHLRGPPIRLALALPTNSKTWLERVSKDKPSSLLGLVVSDKGKKFYNIDTRSQCFKTFRVLILHFGSTRLSVNVDKMKSKFSDKCFQFRPHFYTTKWAEVDWGSFISQLIRAMLNFPKNNDKNLNRNTYQHQFTFWFGNDFLYPIQGTFSDGEGPVQLISLYWLVRSTTFDIANIIDFLQNKLY